MAALKPWLLLLLTVLALFSKGVSSEEDDGDSPYEGDEGADDDIGMGDEGLMEEEDLEDSIIIGPHPDIKTTYIFPDYSTLSIPYGKPVDILVAVTNLGREEKEFNITGVVGSINSPFDYSYYVQNFTKLEMNTLIKPGEQQSILYTFTPDKNLEPMEFQLSAHVFYEDNSELDSERYATTFYNETTAFYEPSSELDPKTAFSYILYATVAALVLLIVLRSQQGSKAKPAGKKKSENTTSENEWLDGIVNKSGSSKKAVGAKSPKSKNKKA